jgi:hypothetical protein
VNYTILVRAYDGEDFSETLVWHVNVESDQEIPQINDDDDDPAFGAALLFVALVVVVVSWNRPGIIWERDRNRKLVKNRKN